MGLPGAGKTTLSIELAKLLNAVHFNADEIRREINKDLKFELIDRIEHARRVGILCDIVTRSGNYAIADFVCPTRETRKAFGADKAFVICADRIEAGRYEDTNKLFEYPTLCHVRVGNIGTPEEWAKKIYDKIVLT